MVVKFDELRVLKAAENVADDIWKQVCILSSFEKGTVGKQLTRAADSIGAKSQKYTKNKSKLIREPEVEYQLAETSHEHKFFFEDGDLFSIDEIQSLQTLPDNET